MSISSIVFLLERNRPADAEAAAREALSKDPENLELLVFLTVSLLDQSKPKAAESVARDLIGKDPDFEHGYFLLARALSERSNPKQALSAIEKAIALDPDEASYHGYQASLLAALQKNDAAIEAAERGLAIDPDDDTCRFYRSILLSKSGRYDEADSEASGLLAEDPDEATNHCARGWVLHLAGDAEGAERHFIEALRIDPGHEDARVGLAEALKMKNPVLGWVMKGLLWIARWPWYYFLGGLVAANVVGRFLRGMDNPIATIAAKGLQGTIMSALLIMLAHAPLLNLSLACSSRGRLALSDDEKMALKWAVLPLLAGGVYLVLWWTGGLKSLPFLAAACLSLSALIAEIVESPRRQVRVAMTIISGVAAVVTIYLFAMTYLWYQPMAIEVIKDAVEAAKEDQATSEDARQALALKLTELFSLRRKFIDYPSFAIFVAAGFRVDIREFFERRSSDSVG